jgi:hypothetical protein
VSVQRVDVEKLLADVALLDEIDEARLAEYVHRSNLATRAQRALADRSPLGDSTIAGAQYRASMKAGER